MVDPAGDFSERIEHGPEIAGEELGGFVGLSKQRRSVGLPLTSSDVEAAGDAVWHLVARPLTPTSKDLS